MAIIAGASRALRYKEKYPDASNEESLRYVVSKADEIIENID